MPGYCFDTINSMNNRDAASDKNLMRRSFLEFSFSRGYDEYDRRTVPLSLDVEQEVHDVAVLNHVFFAFGTEQTFFFGK